MARKIVKAIRRVTGSAAMRYTRDQMRRACLRVFMSPLQVTSNGVASSATTIARACGGRAFAISAKLGVFEQRRRLWDVVRVAGPEGRGLMLRPRER